MNLRYEPVTEDNAAAVRALRKAPDQENFVESVDECLAEASQLRCWRPVAIYDAAQLVGFAMYGLFQEPPADRVWLDRLLIDAPWQGRGYGRRAMEDLLDRLQREYHCQTIYLSVVEGNDSAARLYQDLGFAYTGERDLHGERVMAYTNPRTQRRGA